MRSISRVRHKWLKLAVGAGLCLGFSLASATVWAAGPTGLTVSPSQILLTLDQNDSRQSVQIKFTNHDQHPLLLSITTVDFEGLDQSGGVSFVGQNATQFTQRYGLSHWLTLDRSSLDLDAGQTATVTATITNAQSLSPGGHYGAVVATVQAPDHATGVGVHSSIASLFFVTKQGGAEAQLQLQSLEPNHTWWGGVEASTASFNYTGNVHVVPRGIIQVIDPANRVIAKGVINANSSILLPGQHRTFEVPLLRLGWPWLPGTYRIASQYRTDGGQSLQTKIVVFQQIGLLLPLVILLVLVAAISFVVTRRARRKIEPIKPII